MRNRYVPLIGIAGVIALLVLGAEAVRADSSGGQIICLGRYALCSSAQCTPVANDKEHVSCACEVPPEGLNIGDSTCQQRAQKLTSTFSLWDLTATKDKKAKRAMACTGDHAGPWAFCLDAPCTEKDGKATCTCKLMPKSDYYTFIRDCPSSNSALADTCGKIWSGALQAELLSGYSQLWSFYANIPKLEYCPR